MKIESTTKELLENSAQLISEQGDPCDFGCSEDEVEKVVARAKELFPSKPYCLVSRWCWADIDFDPSLTETMRRTGVQPSFIYANTIIFDEAGRWAEASCVRTTLLVAFHDQCIFSTSNTTYILVGPGVRLRVIPQVYNSLVLD